MQLRADSVFEHTVSVLIFSRHSLVAQSVESFFYVSLEMICVLLLSVLDSVLNYSSLSFLKFRLPFHP